jgi:hypothetical protein
MECQIATKKKRSLPKHVVDVAEPEWRIVVVVVVQLLAGSSTWW